MISFGLVRGLSKKKLTDEFNQQTLQKMFINLKKCN